MNYENEYEDNCLTDADLALIISDYQKKQMIENLTGPGISLVSHMMLLILAFVFIATSNPQKEPPLVVETVIVDELELEDEIIEEIEELEEEVDETAPIEEINAPKSEIGEETSPVDVSDEAPQTDDQTEMEDVLDIVNNNSVLTFHGPTGGRNDAGRRNAIGKYGDGNSRRGQERLNRALRWLASVQNDNGSWGEGKGYGPQTGHPAHTGLALLVFLAHGDTPLSEEYGKTVQNAMRWLGEYGNQSDLNVKRRPMGYAHGIATYAISEAYTMTKIPFMQTAMENCIDKLIDGQMGNGCFGYGYTNGPRADGSVSFWNYQALKAARMAGCSHEKLNSAIKKSVQALNSHLYCGNGQFAYTNTSGKKGSNPNMNGGGALSLQLFGHGDSNKVRETLELIGKKDLLKLEQVAQDPSKFNSIVSHTLYGDYYRTQVVFNSQNTHKKLWKRWRNAFENVLIRGQHDEGYWEISAHGGGPTTPGRVYSTCLASLMLTCYYRYLPTFDQTKLTEDNVNNNDIVNVGNNGGMVIEIE